MAELFLRDRMNELFTWIKTLPRRKKDRYFKQENNYKITSSGHIKLVKRLLNV